jgi:hemoglobin
VIDHFSDAVVKNPIVGITSKNPALREWHTRRLDRLPGLKFMRTLWVCAVAGGPFQYTPTKPGKTAVGLEEAHRDLRISPDEFDEVAAELGRTLDVVKVPQREKEEVLAAFAAHKNGVTVCTPFCNGKAVRRAAWLAAWRVSFAVIVFSFLDLIPAEPTNSSRNTLSLPVDRVEQPTSITATRSVNNSDCTFFLAMGTPERLVPTAPSRAIVRRIPSSRIDAAHAWRPRRAL